jgi:hypothetical protein
MAPAAVQTKHSVEEKITSAPADSTHAAMAGPGMPSRSPMMIAFLFFKTAILIPPFLACFIYTDFRDKPRYIF